MSDPVNLDELDRLHEAATPGPWMGETGSKDPWVGIGVGYLAEDESCEVQVAGWPEMWDPDTGLDLIYRDRLVAELCDQNCGADASLMVALRNAYPAMAAELRKHRESLDEVNEWMSELGCRDICDAVDRIKSHRHELALLAEHWRAICRGKDHEIAAQAAELRALRERQAKSREEIECAQDDLRAILRAVGIGDHARQSSFHQVVHDEVIPAIMMMRDDATDPDDCELDKIVEGTLEAEKRDPRKIQRLQTIRSCLHDLLLTFTGYGGLVPRQKIDRARDAISRYDEEFGRE